MGKEMSVKQMARLGGIARAAKLTAETRASIVRRVAAKRWRMSLARVAARTAKDQNEFWFSRRRSGSFVKHSRPNPDFAQTR